jgi:hypothetical protein
MQVKLSDDERRRIVDALYIARLFYEKNRKKEEYFEVDDLCELLFFADELLADLSDANTTYSEDSKKLKDLLKEREARKKAGEQGCKVFQFRLMPEGPDDPDDPDEVEADTIITRKMKEIAKEHPEI